MPCSNSSFCPCALNPFELAPVTTNLAPTSFLKSRLRLSRHGTLASRTLLCHHAHADFWAMAGTGRASHVLRPNQLAGPASAQALAVRQPRFGQNDVAVVVKTVLGSHFGW